MITQTMGSNKEGTPVRANEKELIKIVQYKGHTYLSSHVRKLILTKNRSFQRTNNYFGEGSGIV
jgi:hypothetical protein